jgi:hypothetical protein
MYRRDGGGLLGGKGKRRLFPVSLLATSREDGRGGRGLTE